MKNHQLLEKACLVTEEVKTIFAEALRRGDIKEMTELELHHWMMQQLNEKRPISVGDFVTVSLEVEGEAAVRQGHVMELEPLKVRGESGVIYENCHAPVRVSNPPIGSPSRRTAALQADRSRLLMWAEPWPAVDENGKETYGHVTNMATVRDCINLSRWIHQKKGFFGADEYDLLTDFLATHWAMPAPPSMAQVARRTGMEGRWAVRIVKHDAPESRKFLAGRRAGAFCWTEAIEEAEMIPLLHVETLLDELYAKGETVRAGIVRVPD